jgi:uncharacterized protein (TIGR03435 family)
MRRATGPALLAFAFALGLFGQATPNRPSFEVASVKVNTTDMVSNRVPRRSGDNVRMHNAPLEVFVIYAYRVENPVYQLADKAGLLGADTHYDVDAIAPGAVSEDDLRLMFQTLLEDRFKLKVHWETRELAGYDLVVAKGGLKMKPSSPDNKIAVDGNSFPLGTSTVFIGADRVAHLIGKGSSVEQLVYSLTGRVRSPVRDRTGLAGTFDYDVIFALNDLQADANSAPMLTTAIQEGLGLKLEKSKIPVKVLVVDHVEKPAAN